MDEKFAILSRGPNFVEGEGYNTIKQARDDGALVLAWGYVTVTLIDREQASNLFQCFC